MPICIFDYLDLLLVLAGFDGFSVDPMTYLEHLSESKNQLKHAKTFSQFGQNLIKFTFFQSENHER